jgi:hypothetical protein
MPTTYAAIVADKVLVLAEAGVAVGGKHLSVRVHIDALALRLLEQRLEVLQVVARDEDGLAFDLSDARLGRCRVAKRLGVGLVEESEGGKVGLARLQRQAEHLVKLLLGLAELVQRLHGVLRDLGVREPELRRNSA